MKLSRFMFLQSSAQPWHSVFSVRTARMNRGSALENADHGIEGWGAGSGITATPKEPKRN